MRALNVATLLLIAAGAVGLSYGGIHGIQARRAIDAAQRENRALKIQREALRKQAFDLTCRLVDDVEREHRMARLAGAPGHVWEGQRVALARGSGDDVLQAWPFELGLRVDARGLREAATPPRAFVVSEPLTTRHP